MLQVIFWLFSFLMICLQSKVGFCESRHVKIAGVEYELPIEEPQLMEQIYNKKLEAEFSQKYREKFGHSDTQSQLFNPTQFGVPLDSRVRAEELPEQRTQKQEFGAYMIRRISEYHVDQYFRKDPKMRPVLELKEKLSNVQLQVRKDIRLRTQYSFSSNNFDMFVDNPWIDLRFNWDQRISTNDQKSQYSDTQMIVGKNLTPRKRLNGRMTNTDGTWGVEWVEQLTHRLQTNVSTSTYYRNQGVNPREQRVLLGLVASF